LRHALGLAKDQRARLHVLNVVDDMIVAPMADDAETLMVESRGRYVSDVILHHARAWRADVIVMGTHGRRGLKRLLLGSDAERVLREAPVPVLLVRAEPTTRRAAKKRTMKRR